MKKKPAGPVRTILCLLFIAGAFPARAQGPRPDPGQPDTFAHENTVRRLAAKTVTPAYPEEALGRGAQGLAAVLIRIKDDDGEVLKVELLAAPDPSIGEAVFAAVKQWEFKPIARDGRSTDSTLRFNFVIEAGAGRVEYGPLPKCQSGGRRMPDGTWRQKLEDIDCPN